jgi:hypothetical protein
MDTDRLFSALMIHLAGCRQACGREFFSLKIDDDPRVAPEMALPNPPMKNAFI